MNVKELKSKLEGLPDEMEVYVCGGKTEYIYGLLNSIYVTEIISGEDLEKGVEEPEQFEALILDEE